MGFRIIQSYLHNMRYRARALPILVTISIWDFSFVIVAVAAAAAAVVVVVVVVVTTCCCADTACIDQSRLQ